MASGKISTHNPTPNGDFLLSAQDFLRLNQEQKRSYIEALQDFMVRADFGNNPELKAVSIIYLLKMLSQLQSAMNVFSLDTSVNLYLLVSD